MSSALTGNKIKDSYQAVLKIGTNGSLDPTTPIAISDGLGNDTPLQVSGNRFNTQYLASNIGLDLNFSGNAYTIGDYDFTSTTTQLKVDVNGQQIITNSSGGYRGFNLDFFNDSYQFGDINGVTNANLFVIDNASSIIKTMKSGNDIGLKLDFANDSYSLGDPDNVGNGNFISINNAGNAIYLNSQSGGTFFAAESVSLDSSNKQSLINDGLNQLIFTGNDNVTYSGPRGIKLDFANNLYSFGDFDSVSSGTSFFIDQANSTIYTQHSGQQEGLFFDFVNDYFKIGDFGNTNNGTVLNIDDDNKVIVTRSGFLGAEIGLLLNFDKNSYYLGDFSNLNNNTYLRVNDDVDLIRLNCESLDFNGAGLESVVNPSGGSGKWLVITLNGNQYKIRLDLP